jgi:hypothetical protein
MSRRYGRRVSDTAGDGTIFGANFTRIGVSKLAGGSGAGTAFEAATGWRLNRASAATVQTGTSTVDSTPTNDDARFGKADDSWQTGLVLEEARTNALLQNVSLAAPSPWTLTNATNPSTLTGPDAGTAQLIDDATAVALGALSQSYASGSRVVSAWYKNTAGDVGSIGDGTALAYGDASGTWKRLALANATSTVATLYPGSRNPQAVAGIGTAGFWGPQSEVGAFPTEAIITTGAAATRGVDNCRIQNVSVLNAIAAPRIQRFEISFRPKGAIASYVSTPVFFRGQGTGEQFESWFTPATGVITISVAGTDRTLATPITWAANDLVDMFFVFGGDAAPQVYYRVNSGPAVSLGAASGVHTHVSTLIRLSLFSEDTAFPFSAWVYKFAAYQPGARPAWVP